MEIINFGKYKGQPFEILKQDPKYLEWLQNQAWFKRQYSQINTLIVNNFKEPSKTPEHNRLQLQFLDVNFCDSFFNLLIKRGHINTTYKKKSYVMVDTEQLRRINGYCVPNDVKSIFIPNQNPTKSIKIPSLKDLGKHADEYETFIGKERKELIEDAPINYVYENCLFEHDRADVYLSYYDKESGLRRVFNIEIKPILSDDFPAVLRQCNSNKSDYLIIDKFEFSNVTLGQVIEVFKRSGINLISFSEFDGKGIWNA